jgi:hypothetical protein
MLQDFMSALANDLLPLPRNIRTLSISLILAQGSKESDTGISSVVEKLGARYPGLRKVIRVRFEFWNMN